jgi:hypothetical protein
MPSTQADDRRALRATRTALRSLTDTLTVCLAAMDQVMQGPSTETRGKRVAAIANVLDNANDAALRYGLGLSFPAIARRKENARRDAQMMHDTHATNRKETHS